MQERPPISSRYARVISSPLTILNRLSALVSLDITLLVNCSRKSSATLQSGKFRRMYRPRVVRVRRSGRNFMPSWRA